MKPATAAVVRDILVRNVDHTSVLVSDLQRYVTEFEFRYNNRSGLGVTDGERTALAMKGIEGKRLTYRPTNEN